MSSLPRLLFTLGDVAGIGPEIVVKAWPDLLAVCRPVVIGDPGWLDRARDLVQSRAQVEFCRDVAAAEPTPTRIPCVAASSQDLSTVGPGRVTAAAGRAAYDFLCYAIDATLAKRADGIVTAPLHKEGLHAAGLRYPGHTEILAERTGVREFAMVLA